jgi:hypothetical protein
MDKRLPSRISIMHIRQHFSGEGGVVGALICPRATRTHNERSVSEGMFQIDSTVHFSWGVSPHRVFVTAVVQCLLPDLNDGASLYGCPSVAIVQPTVIIVDSSVKRYPQNVSNLLFLGIFIIGRTSYHRTGTKWKSQPVCT